MKKIKKLAGLLLAMIMMFTLTAIVFAAENSGNTGSITINGSTAIGDNNVSVEGKTFNAYKILDLQMVGTGYVYTVPDELKEFYKTQFRLTGNEGDFDYQAAQKIAALKGDAAKLFEFAKAALAAAKTAGIAPKSATGEEGNISVTIDRLPLGYYVVEDVGEAKPISALILDSTAPDVTVHIKAEKPTIDKKIDGATDTDDSTTGDVVNNNAAIGDKVPYKVTSTVPDMTGYTKYYFVVKDTLSKGLTFNKDLEIKIGSTTIGKCTHETEEAHTNCYNLIETPNNDGTTTIEIIFKNFIQYQSVKGSKISITYSATVNGDAVIGAEGNPNKVMLTYSHNPNINDEGDPDKPGPNSPVGVTPESETRTYVTDLELIKVDPAGNRLTGAEFEITGNKLNTVLVRKDVFTKANDGAYWKLKDGTYTMDDPTGEGMDQDKYDNITEKYTKDSITETIKKKEEVHYTGTVGEDGVLRFAGLSAGEYEITELKAPAGYNLLSAPIKVTINFEAPTAPSTDGIWSYIGTDVVNGQGTNHITIINQAGVELPSTGGRGTTMIYIVGGILFVGAAILLIVRRRTAGKNK